MDKERPGNETGFAKTFREKVLNPDTRPEWINLLYMVITCGVFLHHIHVTVYYNVIRDGTDILEIPWLILSAISIILGRMWKDKGFWLLLGLIAIKTIRQAASGAFPEAARGIELNLYAFFICYATGRVLNSRDRKRLLQWICALWTLAMAVFSLFGLYAVWTGTEIPNLGNSPVYVRDNRLVIVYHFVETGILEGASIGVALAGLMLTKNRIGKGLYFLAIPVMLLAEGMTATRTAFVIVGVEIAALVCVLLDRRMAKRERIQKRSVSDLLLLAGTFAVCMVTVTWLQTLIIDGFNAVRHYGLLVGNALAENAGSTGVIHRGFDFSSADGLLTGRVAIWQEAFMVIKENPRILLSGMPTEEFMARINEIRKAAGLFHVYGTHSVFIQTLMEYGLGALAIYACFQIRFVLHAFRLLKNREQETWKRIIALPAIGCLLCEFVDQTTYGGLPQTTIMYLFIGLTIAISQSSRKGNNPNEQNC